MKTNNKQQTAVEWLLNAIQTKNGEEFSSYYTEFIEQAKEMEKEKMIEFTNEWFEEYQCGLGNFKNPEQYYNETYGGGEQ